MVAGARRHAPVIVVDDGSSDGSAAEAARAGAEVIRHPRRRGKAAALRTGFEAARARGAAAVVTLDGDGQHAPDDVPVLLQRRARDARPAGGGQSPRRSGARFPRARLNAMEVAAFFVEWVSALGMRDTQSGFRVYPVALARRRGGMSRGLRLRDRGADRGGAARLARARGDRLVDPLRPAAQPLPPGARRRGHRGLSDGTSPGPVGAGDHGEPVRRPCPGRGGTGPERRRRARAAALATVATPVLLGAAVMQAGLGRVGVDLVTPSCGGSTRAIASPAWPRRRPVAPRRLPEVEPSFAPSRATRA